MELQNMDIRGGSLQISTEVLGKIARCAALEVEGVAEVSCGKQNKKVKDLLERANVQSPVMVEMRDGTAEITLHLVVAFGARIPTVAEKVQENVKYAVHDQCHRQPGRSCHLRPCPGGPAGRLSIPVQTQNGNFITLNQNKSGGFCTLL